MSKFISLTGLSEFLTKCRALFYTKPSGGIPSSDLASAIQTSLGKADSAYQKPNSGIPKTDLASGVQSSLDLADSSVQANPVGSVTPAVDPYDYATREEVSQLGQKVDVAVDTMEVASVNLFDKTAATASRYVNINSGELASNASYYATDYIPIDSRGLYCYLGYAGGSAIGCAVYNSSKQYIRGAKAISVSYENGDAYVRFTVLATNIDSAMCVAGTVDDVPSDYVPFGNIPVYSLKPQSSIILSLDTLPSVSGYVTESSGKVLFYEVEGCKYLRIPKSSIPTQKIKITATTLASPYNVVCVIGSRTGVSLGTYSSPGITSYKDFEINIPAGAFYIYVNCQTANTPIITTITDNGSINSYIRRLSLNGDLWGKKCVCFGDSITWYDGNAYNWGKEQGEIAKGYESYMREQGMDVVNRGYSGANITGVLSRIRNTDLTGYDFVTITSGANDSRYQIPTGTLVTDGSTFDETTFIGALQAAIEYVLAENPTAKILLITPIKGWIYYPEGYVNAARPLVSGDGVVEQRYVDAIKTVAAYYSLPVCDWYNEAGVNLLTRSWYMNDPEPDPSATPNPNDLYSLHPTAAGYKRMADILIPVLRNM